MRQIEPQNIEVIELYNGGKTPKEIADITGRKIGNVNNAISRARKMGMVTRYVYNKTRKKRIDTPVKLYIRHRIRTGWIWDIIGDMSEDVADHYIDLCINGGYKNLAECFSDVLIEKYFEEKSE